ncbi:MAG: response regulator transcription factor [Hahellaceae bacterium]|jgi:DNA-binding NarL/FixJ family response regulator|nr:response regulator transcription factor [Hahellaceae bacterium]MCP5211125.1 response regulator transcription factor [Hahellaceae bacterium]
MLKNFLSDNYRLNLMVVDDHPLYVEGLTLALARLTPTEHIQAFTNGIDALEWVLSGKRVDLILLDLNLPDQDGISFLQQIRKRKLPIPIVILSASEDPADVHASLVAGASGFISKASSSAQLIASINEALSGNPCVPDFYQPSANIANSLTDDLNITPRQLEVLKLLASGMPNKRICTTLGLTEHTVKSHLKALFSALEVHNRTECVNVAARLGLI